MSNDYIQPERLFVNEIFLQDFYIVPIYQRSYAWEKEQIEQLINDIYDAKEKDVYFIGSLIVDYQAKHTYSVIDEQQRLTTLYLLMSYLQKSLLKSKCLTFEAREESNNVLEALLKFDFSKNEDFISNDSFNDEIATGIKRIQAFFRTKDKDFKNTIINNLSKVILIRTQVPKNIDLNHYFEIMNTRGEQLELHEIAKGRILSKIISSYDKKIAAQIWEACAHMDEYIQMCLPNDIRFKLFGKDWKEFECKNFNDIRTKYIELEKEKADKEHKPEPVIVENDEVKNYSLNDLIHDESIKIPSEKQSSEENERFESIVSFPNFLLLVNEARNLGENDSSLDDKNFLKILGPIWESEDKKVADENCKEFIYQMLKMKFLFDKYVLKREFAKDYKNEGKWSLQRLERTEKNNQDKPKYVTTFFEIDKDEITLQNIRTLQAALRITYTSPKTMHWISQLLNYLSALMETNNIKSELILTFLEKYACIKVSKSDYRNKSGFEIERIVFTYLDYILYRDRRDSYSNFQFQFRTSIEHFHPQHPIEDDWSYLEEEKKGYYLNHFGNLVLITVKANSRFTNLSPNSKIDSYAETLDQSIKFKLMNEVRIKYKNNWSPEAVIEHGEEMLLLLDSEMKKYGL